MGQLLSPHQILTPEVTYMVTANFVKCTNLPVIVNFEVYLEVWAFFHKVRWAGFVLLQLSGVQNNSDL